jgi:hypothetical protein
VVEKEWRIRHAGLWRAMRADSTKAQTWAQKSNNYYYFILNLA